MLLPPELLSPNAPFPKALLDAPEVKFVKAVLPIAVLFPPLTEASKALSPRTVLPATEFAPLPNIYTIYSSVNRKSWPTSKTK